MLGVNPPEVPAVLHDLLKGAEDDQVVALLSPEQEWSGLAEVLGCLAGTGVHEHLVPQGVVLAVTTLKTAYGDTTVPLRQVVARL